VRVAIRKLPGVESVDVSLERATAEIRLRPNNTVTLPQLREIIKRSGFNAKEATVTAVGTLVERGGRPAIDVSGIDTVWLIVPDSSRRAAYDDAAGRVKTGRSQTVEISGLIAEPKDSGAPEQIAVRAVTVSK
jgi:copper chaperone CopZ